MTTRQFDRAPAALPLLVKAALPALPVVGSLPGVKHASDGTPDLLLERRGVTTDLAHLETYREVCAFPRADQLPVTYPHMAAFGLHLALMTDTSFPFAPMGLVHLRNRITQHRPIARGETFDIAVRATGLRPHPKGRLIDVVTTVTVGEETVWDETTTHLSRGRGGAAETSTPVLDTVKAPRGVVHWHLAGDLGRRYGAVSGDRNPIHLYPLTAKPFGFPTNIAHGMWTKARCLAALQNQLPETFTVDVEFKKPVLLPTTVVFGSETSDAGLTFGVRAQKEDLTHLVGRISH